MKTILILLITLLSTPLLAADPQVHRDLAYVEPKNEKQTLDVFAPAEGKDHPIVFWIHGGGWRYGDKSEMKAKPQAFVDKGYVFVSTNYRLLPDVTIKEITEDIAKAIKWTHDHAKEYGGDPNTIFVMGHSAGAQLAALICTDDRYLKAEGLSLSILKGCVPLDGDTFDVPLQIATEPQKSAETHSMKFGSIERQKDLSPVTHVAKGKDIPPFLILHVAVDPLTTMQAQRLSKALQEVGVSAKAYPAEEKNHTTINAELGLPEDKPTQAIWEFMESTKLIRVGNEQDLMSGYELERSEKTSTIKIARKQGDRISAVGRSLFVVSVFYEVAKSRQCKYFTNLKEWKDDDGNLMYTAGFTNEKEANIKKEFGEQFSDTTESGQKRKLMSVTEFESVFEKGR